MIRNAIPLLTSDDPYSGVVSRQDVLELLTVALIILESHPDEARRLWDVTRRIRATIPSSAWDLTFPVADPAIGMESTL